MPCIKYWTIEIQYEDKFHIEYKIFNDMPIYTDQKQINKSESKSDKTEVVASIK